jgi:hypothetical protein
MTPIDDAEIPEHQVGDQYLLVKRPSRVRELDVTETVDGTLHVNGVPRVTVESRRNRT